MKLLCPLIIVLLLAGCGGEKVKPSLNISINESRQVAEGWDENVAFSDSVSPKLYYFISISENLSCPLKR